MRIALDARHTTAHFPGIGRYVYNLLQALALLNQPHQLLVLHNPQGARYDLSPLARFPQIELVPVGARPFSIAEHYEIPKILRRVRADLYHAPYYVRPYLGLPCPSVTTLYDIIPRMFPQQASFRARLLFDLLTRLSIRASRRVLAISASARDDLAAAYKINPAKISVTPLAADPRFQPQPESIHAALRSKYGLPEPYLLTLASNKPHKNLVRLVEAWAICLEQANKRTSEQRTKNKEQENKRTATNGHPVTRSPGHQWSLVIAGHWEARYPEARELVARLGLAETVRFISDIREEDLPALYSAAEAFVFPSLYEGFGLPPLEAMACGTPVLCGNRSSLPEVVGEAALQVDVLDPAALAGAITTIMEDQAFRRRLAEAGLQRAAHFSWQHTAALTIEAYNQARSAL